MRRHYCANVFLLSVRKKKKKTGICFFVVVWYLCVYFYTHVFYYKWIDTYKLLLMIFNWLCLRKHTFFQRTVPAGSWKLDVFSTRTLYRVVSMYVCNMHAWHSTRNAVRECIDKYYNFRLGRKQTGKNVDV